jgi:hypothetical protein
MAIDQISLTKYNRDLSKPFISGSNFLFVTNNIFENFTESIYAQE